MMKRWYSIGKIKVAEFNGEGFINVLDYNMADAAITRAESFTVSDPTHRQIFPAVFGNGDIDGNGVIDEADRTLFKNIYWSQHLLGTDVIVEFKVVGSGASNHDY